jgi:hypothetical protein
LGRETTSRRYCSAIQREALAVWRTTCRNKIEEDDNLSGMEKFRENFAGLANLYFFFFIGIFGAITKGARHVPAHVAAIKFPGRTLFFHRTELFLPATQRVALAPPLVEIEKIEELFGMGGNSPPPLLVAMDGFERDAEQLGELLLGFAQSLSDEFEIVSVHSRAPFKSNAENEMEIPISTKAYHILAPSPRKKHC